MSEENGTTDAGEAAASTEAAASAQPTSFVGNDGVLNEGWRDAYLTDDIKDEKVFERATTVQGVLKSLASAERMVGADKMVKPSDKFGDEEWDEFHKAGGWTGDPIAITAPEGLPEGVWSDERATTYSEGFNSLRLNPKQVAGLMELHNADIVQQLTDRDNNADTARAELKANLLAEKGNAYAQFQHNGNFAINKGVQGDKEFQDRIIQKFVDDPDFVRLMGNLGGEFSESGPVPLNKQAATPADIDAKLAEIRNSDAFNNPNHPNHKSTMKNLSRLHLEKAQIRQPV